MALVGQTNQPTNEFGPQETLVAGKGQMRSTSVQVDVGQRASSPQLAMTTRAFVLPDGEPVALMCSMTSKPVMTRPNTTWWPSSQRVGPRAAGGRG